jgi:hypothetical protein
MRSARHGHVGDGEAELLRRELLEALVHALPLQPAGGLLALVKLELGQDADNVGREVRPHARLHQALEKLLAWTVLEPGHLADDHTKSLRAEAPEAPPRALLQQQQEGLAWKLELRHTLDGKVELLWAEVLEAPPREHLQQDLDEVLGRLLRLDRAVLRVEEPLRTPTLEASAQALPRQALHEGRTREMIQPGQAIDDAGDMPSLEGIGRLFPELLTPFDQAHKARILRHLWPRSRLGQPGGNTSSS